MINMKTTNILRTFSAALLSTAFLLALGATSRADFDFTVNLNVASLIGNGNGPFSLDLQLAAGSQTVTNTVTITNFQLNGGSFTGSQTIVAGGVTGSFTSTPLVLTNSSLDNEVYQTFSANVTNISFNVDETVHTDSPTADDFNVAILDNTDSNIPTTDPNSDDIAADEWALLKSSSGTLSVNQVGTYTSTSPDAGATALATVPEPGSAALLLFGVVGLVTRRKMLRRA